MPLPKLFKVSRKTFFDPTSWLDVDGLKAQNQTLLSILMDLFVVPKPERKETFEEAMARLNVSLPEADNAAKMYRLYALLFLIIGLLVFGFAFYLLFMHVSFTGWLLAFAASALFAVQAFKYDFWAFQIRHRKLGCTFAEWRSGKTNKETT